MVLRVISSLRMYACVPVRARARARARVRIILNVFIYSKFRFITSIHRYQTVFKKLRQSRQLPSSLLSETFLAATCVRASIFLTLRFACNVADGAVAEITMTMDVSKSETNKNGSTQQECAGCGKTITER